MAGLVEIEYELWLNDLQKRTAHCYGFWIGGEFEPVNYQSYLWKYQSHHKVAATACKMP